MVTKTHFRELVKHIPAFLSHSDLLAFSLVNIECHLAAQPTLFRRLRIDSNMDEAVVNHLMRKGMHIHHMTLKNVTLTKFNAAVCLLSLKHLKILEVSWCHKVSLNWLCRMVAQNKHLSTLQVFLVNRYQREERRVRRSTYPSDPVLFTLVDWQLYQLLHVLPSGLTNLALFQPHADITFATLPLLASKLSHRLQKLALASTNVDMRFAKFLVDHLPLLQSLVITATSDMEVKEFVARYNEEAHRRKLIAALSSSSPNGNELCISFDHLPLYHCQDLIEFFPDVECLSNSESEDEAFY